MNSAWRVTLHAAADHRAVEHVQRCEQRGRAVPRVVVGHRGGPAALERQPWLCAVECLDLARLVDRAHHGVGRRIDIQADHVHELGGELRVARALEAAHAMRLQLVRLPDALHRAQREAGRCGHRPASPVGRRVRRIGTRHRHHAGHDLGRDRRFAGLAGLVAQQSVHARFGEALLPPPDHRPADPDRRGDLLHRPAPGRCQHDPRSLGVLARPVAIRRNRLQSRPLRCTHDHADCLGHAGRLARPRPPVNRQNVSEH